MTTTNYGVINKETNKYFSGFNKNHSIKWVSDKSKAWSGSKDQAKAQASLFISTGVKGVQRKAAQL